MTIHAEVGVLQVAPQPTSWEVRAGDVWDLSTDLLPESLRAIITSPPYWGLRSYGQQHDDGVLARWVAEGNSPEAAPSYDWYRNAGGVLGLEPYPQWFVEHLAEIFDRIGPALAADGNLWVNLGDTYFARWSSIREQGRQGLGGAARERRVTPTGGFLHDKQLLLIPARFAIAMQDRGWILRNDVIWQKPNVAPRPERDRLRLSHEHFFHFVKRQRSSRPSYYYNLEQVESGALDVVSVKTSRAEAAHSATFPLELIEPRVRSSSEEGDVILDPFCGTGTTLLAALHNGRSGLGFEISDDFAAGTRERITAAGFGMHEVGSELDR